MKYSYLDVLAQYGVEAAHPGGPQLTKDLLSRENITPRTVVLDAGCGTGKTSEYLARTFRCKVYAIDIHPEMVNKTVQRLQYAKLPAMVYQGSMEKLPFQSHFFDLIFAESTTGFTRLSKTLREYHRVLKPGGIVLSNDMTAESPLTPAEKKEIQSFYGIKHIPTENEWLKAFKRYGFLRTAILHGTSIANVMAQEPPQAYTEGADSIFTKTMSEHARLMQRYAHLLGYRVFRAVK
ncbi:MAG: class I SAM-dependent methyltransferase [Bacillus sp. (in: firmicutes)]